MTFTLLTSAKFFMFQLARSLNHSGNLQKILTGYPRNRVMEEGIDKAKISSHSLYQISGYLIGKLPLDLKNIDSKIADLNVVHLDRYAAQEIGDSHLISMSSLAAKTGKLVNARGNRFILNRSSQHILSQTALLKHEFLKWKWEGEGDLPTKLVIGRELVEYESAFRIVVPSQLTKKSFLERGFSDEKIVVNQIPVQEAIPEQELNNFPNASHKTGILFVGQVTLRKGFPTLVKAFNSVADPSIKLHVAGPYSAKFLKHLTSMGLNLEKIRFYGPLNSRELAKLYTRCEMFVLPSIEDGWGLVVNEALRYGCIPIVSESAGASEIIENGVNGYTFSAGNDRELLNCINRIADSKGNPFKTSSELTKKPSDGLNWDQFATTYLNLVK